MEDFSEHDGLNASENQELIGGATGSDTLLAGEGDDLIFGDTHTSNPDLPLEYTAGLSGLPFEPGSVDYMINGASQSQELSVGSDGSATLSIDPSQMNGSDLEVVVTGMITEFQYEFFDSVPTGMSAANIPTSGADFTGTATDLNVRDLALELTGSHETYSVRYTAEVHVDEGGTYTFSTRSDDGSLLFIDGVEVVSNDGLHGARTRSGDIVLGEGSHTIEIVFFENHGGDLLEVEFSGPDTNGVSVDIVGSGNVGRSETVTQIISPSQVAITGLLQGLNYEFFDSVPSGNTVFNIPETGAAFTGVVDQLDVGALAQDLTGSRDTYAVRYTGELYVENDGTYDFSSLSDDGFALIIDGEIVVLNDGLHAPSGKDGSADLSTGFHDVEILFFENTGQDILNLTITGPDTNGQTIDLFSSPNIGQRGDIQATVGGDDLIDAGAGDDTINAGAGNDSIIGGEGADAIDGGDGDRDAVSFTLSSTGVSVDLDSGLGQGGNAEGDTYVNVEFVYGSTHDDVITGDDGVNRLVGHSGNDELYGLGGKDTLIGGRGADIIDGGDGVDTAEYDWSTAGVTVDLSTGVGVGGYAEGDTLINVENLFGSYFDDVLIGDDGTNRLNGYNGDDVLNGGAGNDVLVGGAGADTLIGGAGDRDAADYSKADEAVTVDLVNGGSAGEADGDTYNGVEFVYGSNHDDMIIGNAANNRLVGNAGDDVLIGGEGKDYLIGGEGADHFDGGAGTGDTVEYREATTGVGVNLDTGGFAGEADGDTYSDVEYVYGSDFSDDITGDAAANRLIGFMGDDVINGGDGNDYIIGMADNDILTGGQGDDVFLYKSIFGADIITDFEAGAGRTDRLWLDLAGIENVSDLTITDTADGALITAGTYGTILLDGVFSAELNNDDFIF